MPKIEYIVTDRYVVDTCALISYFKGIFEEDSSISEKSIGIIDSAFYSHEIILIIPSTVFIEIYKKWFGNSEMKAKIISEIYLRIKSKENMQIQPIDKEILENFSLITNIETAYNFDNHDKQILAAAMTMQCPLITSDKRLIRYNEKQHVIPQIFS